MSGLRPAVREAGIEPALPGSRNPWPANGPLPEGSSGGWGRTSGPLGFSEVLFPLSYTGITRDAGRSRTCFQSGCSRPPGRPAPASSSVRASGGTRTHFVRVTRAVPGRSSIAGALGWPVGVEPTHRRFTAGSRCRFGFGHSASARIRTRTSDFADPRDVRFTTEAFSTPARSRTWTCSFGRSRDGSVSPPRQTVPGVGVEPTPAGSEPAVLPLDDAGIESSP